MKSAHFSPIVLIALALPAACTTTPGQPGHSTAADCVWPASQNPVDGGPLGARCVAKRYQLTCAVSGATLACTSNDPSRCEGHDEIQGPNPSCQSVCRADEYGLACGGLPYGSAPAPANCRGGLPSPGGLTFHCCPCGP